jgi:hypothetical protein
MNGRAAAVNTVAHVKKMLGSLCTWIHIDPQGGDGPENLCLSCSSCNLSKAAAISATDPESGTIVPLFHPRQQLWDEHFEWIDEALRIHGKTATGRATIERLKLNQQHLVRARRNWVEARKHPPA